MDLLQEELVDSATTTELRNEHRSPTAKDESTVCQTRRDRTTQLLEQFELGGEYLTPTGEAQLRTLLKAYSDVFALDSSELGTSSIMQHSINTGDHFPIRQPLRRMPFTLRPQVDKLVQEMLTQGIIQPSSSPWASPVVLVKKRMEPCDFAWIIDA